MVPQAQIEHQKIVDDGTKAIKAAIRAHAQLRKSIPTPGPRGKGFRHGSTPFVHRGRIPTHPMVRAPTRAPAIQRASASVVSHDTWLEFANRGARDLDFNLSVLSRAKDLNSEDAQRALEAVPDRFLTKEMLEAKEALRRKREENKMAEGVLIDFDSAEADSPDPIPRDTSPDSLGWAYEESSHIEELADQTENLSLIEFDEVRGESSRIEELDDDAEDSPRIEELDDDAEDPPRIEELDDDVEDDDEKPEEPKAEHTISGVEVGTLIDLSD